MKSVLLGLGSNNDYNGIDSFDILKNACRDLASFLFDGVYSSVYKTKAMYVENQKDFLNMTVYGFVADEMTPYQLLDKIHVIEAEYGRDRSKEIRFGQRTLDIDIELFADLTINEPDLQIPHLRISERAFVLIPAIEVLKKTADVINRDKFKQYLKNLTSSEKNGVKKVFPAKKFCP